MAETQVSIPPACLNDLALYWSKDFTWDDAYAKWNQVARGEIVTLGACQIGTPEVLVASDHSLFLTDDLHALIEPWYLESRRDTLRQAIQAFFATGCATLSVNKQEDTVTVCVGDAP